MSLQQEQSRIDIEILQTSGKQERQVNARAALLRQYLSWCSNALALTLERRRRIDIVGPEVMQQRVPDCLDLLVHGIAIFIGCALITVESSHRIVSQRLKISLGGTRYSCHSRIVG